MTVGHFAKDIIVVDGKAETASGGGVYFGAMAARQLGLNVAVVTRLHPDDYPLLDELRQAGITVFAAPAAQTSGIENRYRSTDMERRECIPTGFAGPFTPAGSARRHRAECTSSPPSSPARWTWTCWRSSPSADPLPWTSRASCALQDCGILEFRPWPQMREGLRHVTYLKVDRAEAEMLTGTTDLESAARQLAEYGPKEIVLTQSSGVTVLAEGQDLPRAVHVPVTGRPDRPRRHLLSHLSGQAADRRPAGSHAHGCRRDHPEAGTAGSVARDSGRCGSRHAVVGLPGQA